MQKHDPHFKTWHTKSAKDKSLIVVGKDKNQIQRDLAHCELDNIEIHEVMTNDTWARDHAPIGLVEPKCLLNFGFNGWGGKYTYHADNQISRVLCDKGVFTNMSTVDFVLERGAIESRGDGTALISDCVTSSSRNPYFPKDKTEKFLKKILHLKQLCWVEGVVLDGDDTDGHIDTLARFASENTIVYSSCEDPNDSEFVKLARLKEQIEIHAKKLKCDAHALAIPQAIYGRSGRRLPANYANFLIGNGAIYLPTYGQNKKDTYASEVLKSAFPKREIVEIDSTVFIEQGGSVHCLCMNYFE